MPELIWGNRRRRAIRQLTSQKKVVPNWEGERIEEREFLTIFQPGKQLFPIYNNAPRAVSRNQFAIKSLGATEISAGQKSFAPPKYLHCATRLFGFVLVLLRVKDSFFAITRAKLNIFHLKKKKKNTDVFDSPSARTHRQSYNSEIQQRLWKFRRAARSAPNFGQFGQNCSQNLKGDFQAILTVRGHRQRVSWQERGWSKP